MTAFNPVELARQRMNRIAWAVLLTSFALFLGLVIGIPVGVHAYRLHAIRPLHLVTRPTRGTLALQPGPRAPTILVRQIYEGLPDESVLELGAEQNAVLLAYAQEGAAYALTTLRLYGPLKLVLHEARHPRFANSPDAVRLDLKVEYGRLTLVATPQHHDMNLHISTPQGEVRFQNGTATLSISSQSTRLEVYSGDVTLLAQTETRVIPPYTRAVLMNESPITLEALGTPLINNGDFTAGFVAWEAFTRRVEPGGTGGATLSVTTPRALLRAWREAEGLGESGLRQPLLNSTVPTTGTLVIKAALHIIQQEQEVCGPRGDRCPITLRLYYRDATGKSHLWSQGFYALGGSYPQSCLDCENTPPLRALPFHEWVFYESPNLLKLAPAPVTLEALEIAADGSHYEIEVDDVSLLVKE